MRVLNRYGIRWIAVFTIMLILAGCVKEKSPLEALPEDGSGKIKVMYYDEDQFFRSYGNYFTIMFPNVEIEVVNVNKLYESYDASSTPPDQLQQYSDFIEKEQIDVVFADADITKKLLEDGKLYNLDPIIAQEKVTFDDFLPGLIEILREKGNGSLYGLTPTFNTSVLYYNADLFKEKGIAPPTNKMTWQQILDLGAQFSRLSTADEKLYGIANSFSTIENVLSQTAQVSNLQLVDARGEKVLVDSPGWREMLTMVSKAIKEETMYILQQDSAVGMVFDMNEAPFMKGKAAMTIDSLWMASQLKNMGQYNQNEKPFDWQMVTAPVDPNRPDESAYIQLYNVFSIRNDSPNKRAAWELIKFMSSPEMAKATSKVYSGDLPARVSHINDIAGKSADVVKMLRPSSTTGSNYLHKAYEMKLPVEFITSAQQGLTKAIKDIVGGKGVDEIVSPLQLELQKQLEDAKRKLAEEGDETKPKG